MAEKRQKRILRISLLLLGVMCSGFACLPGLEWGDSPYNLRLKVLSAIYGVVSFVCVPLLLIVSSADVRSVLLRRRRSKERLSILVPVLSLLTNIISAVVVVILILIS